MLVNLKGALDLESIAPCTSVPSRPAPSPPEEACGYIRPVKKLTLIPYVVLLMQNKRKIYAILWKDTVSTTHKTVAFLHVSFLYHIPYKCFI